jgi:hypothetical protein
MTTLRFSPSVCLSNVLVAIGCVVFSAVVLMTHLTYRRALDILDFPIKVFVSLVDLTSGASSHKASIAVSKRNVWSLPYLRWESNPHILPDKAF